MDTLRLNNCGFVGGERGESELCINSWFCVILTHFFLLPVVYIHTERIVCWWGSLLLIGVGRWRHLSEGDGGI